ncbi:MAG: hypothetical protein ACREJI_07275, partial [Candidatus Methylomirabilales bacterium]
PAAPGAATGTRGGAGTLFRACEMGTAVRGSQARGLSTSRAFRGQAVTGALSLTVAAKVAGVTGVATFRDVR